MNKKMYSVSADMHTAPLASGVLDYGHAKFLYDRWIQDPEVFNVCMYRHENGEEFLMSPDEIQLL